MFKHSSVPSNIANRSPWHVQVRSQPALDKQFAFGARKKAEAYLEQCQAQGRRATLMQLATAFQLRVRRKGIKDQYLTFDTFKEAEQARLKLESDLSVSIVRDYAVAAQHTLADLVRRYCDEVVPKHKGAKEEVYRINRMLRVEAFLDKKMAAITTEDLQDFIEDRLSEVAPATVDRDLDVISQVINYADDLWKIAAVESPFKGLRRPKYFNERSRRLSTPEEKVLLEAAREDENQYVEPAIILALETAMRRGELLALTANDIDFERRHAVVRTSKNGRSRHVPLTTRAMQVLRPLIAQGNDTLLNLTANALKLAFYNRVIPSSKLQDFHFHDLRHEAISRLAESGRFQLVELQAISGHRDTRMLLRYVHLLSGKLAEKMDEASSGSDNDTYLHRGRKRKKGKRGDGKALLSEVETRAAVAAPAPTIVGAAWGMEGAPLPSNVIAFPVRRIA